MQKVFDVNSKEFWNIFPEKTYKIISAENEIYLYDRDNECFANLVIPTIKIDWHGKTEAIRPASYKDMIGCAGWFWNENVNGRVLGILTKISNNDSPDMVFLNGVSCWYRNFVPAKQYEIKFFECGQSETNLPFNPLYLQKVKNLDVSARAKWCFINANIVYIGDLLQMSESELLRLPNFGRKSLNEVKQALHEKGLHLNTSIPHWKPDNIEELYKQYIGKED